MTTNHITDSSFFYDANGNLTQEGSARCPTQRGFRWVGLSAFLR